MFDRIRMWYWTIDGNVFDDDLFYWVWMWYRPIDWHVLYNFLNHWVWVRNRTIYGDGLVDWNRHLWGNRMAL